MKALFEKIRYIFDRDEKIKFVILFIMLLIGSLFEMLGVSMIMPFLQVAMEPGQIEKNDLYHKIYVLFRCTSVNGFLTVSAVALILIYLIKNIYLIFMNYVQYRFINNHQNRLSVNLLKCYLRKPYTFHTQKNSSEILRIVTNDVAQLFELVKTVLGLMSETLTVTAIGIFLLITDVKMTLVIMFMLAMFVAFVFGFLKKRTYQLGEENRRTNSKMIQWVNQALGGIKEIKVSHTEEFFIEEYRYYGKKNFDISRRIAMYGVIPSYIMEVLLISCVLGMILIKLLLGADILYLISKMSIFIYAAIRLLPSANRISGYLGLLNYLKPSIDVIYSDLRESEEENGRQTGDIYAEEMEQNKSDQEGIEINNLTYRYPDSEENVLDHISFRIPMNKSIAFVGPSGAGKTTLADLILGILEPTEGSITYNGRSIHGNQREWSKLLGYIPQNIYLSDDTIRNNVAFGVNEKDIDDSKIWKVLGEAQLDDFVKSLESGLDTVVGEQGARLSGGQRQRIGIARALYHDPSILVLDEATSALDNETEKAVMQAIEILQGQKTLIIIAHRLSTIEKCDIIFEVNDKSIKQKRGEKK